jgi:hypothetical protein
MVRAPVVDLCLVTELLRHESWKLLEIILQLAAMVERLHQAGLPDKSAVAEASPSQEVEAVELLATEEVCERAVREGSFHSHRLEIPAKDVVQR